MASAIRSISIIFISGSLIFKDNILHLHYADLVPSPFTKDAYNKSRQRGNIVVKGLGGNGREVLIEYESLPSKWKAKLQDKYGNIYNYCAAQIIKPHLIYTDKDAADIKRFRDAKEQELPLEAQEEYKTACAYLRLMATNKKANQIKKLGFASKGQFTEAIQQIIQSEGIKLPANYSNLKAKLRQYEEHGATVVISGRWGNSNTEKITEDIERWMILEMCRTRLSPESVHQRYLKVAQELGFRSDISGEAFKHRLSQPHIHQLISLKRYGKKAVRSKTGQTFKIVPPIYSDDFWQGDGTAIDLAFRNEEGKLGMATVYIVIDVLSECILGYSLRNGLNKENWEMQMEAYRAAVRKTNSKPYQLKYDNQGGHKKGEAKRFYDNLASVHFPSRAYRSSSRRVEGVFGRLQKQILAEYPFWTGYGRQTHSKLEHGHDRQKMQRNIDNLPNFDELSLLWPIIVADWNAAKLKKETLSREEKYIAHKDPKATTLGYTDMVDMFFQVSDPIKYQPKGITLIRDGVHHDYVVYNDEGLVDYTFRERYLKASFHIKYDPEFEYPNVQLLAPMPNGDMRPVAMAQPKRENHDVVKYLEPGERAYIDAELDNEEAFYESLENKAAEMGYVEEEVMTSWRSKIGQKPTKRKQPETAEVDNRSAEDFILDQS